MFRKVFFYCLYIPTLLLVVAYLMTLAWFTPYRSRMNIASLWPGFMSGTGLRWSTGIKVNISGLEKLPKEPFIAVCNHQSEWETMFLARALNPCSIVMKKSLLRIPVYGWGMSLTRPIAIDRTSPKASIKAILNQGMTRLREGSNVLIFPEGTRVQQGNVRKYTRTAFKLATESGAPLVPIVHNAGDFWLRRRFVAGTIQVAIGTPVDSSSHNADELLQMVEDWSRQTYETLVDS